MKRFGICVLLLVIGAVIGGSLVLWHQNSVSGGVVDTMIVETIEGDTDALKHSRVKIKKSTVEFTTTAKKPGKIKTIIKKSAICPKALKNSLSLVVYGGVYDLMPTLSYGIQYRRDVFKRVHVLAGVKIDTSVYRVRGFQALLGAGFNF